MEDFRDQIPKVVLGLAACGIGCYAFKQFGLGIGQDKYKVDMEKQETSIERRYFKKQNSMIRTATSGKGLEFKMHFTEQNKYMVNKFGKDNNDVSVKTYGEESTGEKKVQWVFANKIISPWHDIPHKSSADLVSFVCEIPKFERAKMECATKLPHNPIVQDKTKDGKPRFYHGPIFWNYGYVPQTWENPETIDEELGYKGDADPLDVVEIGMAKRRVGSVTPVKPLGILAMIDSGEVDWKMICIAEDDPLFDQIEDIDDLEQKCPGTVAGIREWFRWYKTPDMKDKNIFGFKEQVLGVKKCWEVINHVHNDWKDLMAGKAGQGEFWTGMGQEQILDFGEQKKDEEDWFGTEEPQK